MHRGRNRSRKPVETQPAPQSQPPAVGAAANGSSFRNHSLYPGIAGGGGGGASSISAPPFSSTGSSSQLHLHMDSTAAASCAALGGGGGTGKDLR
jgi:hypothetical protein